MNYLKFGWLLTGALAGAKGPTQTRDLIFFKRHDIRAMVRTDQESISAESFGLVDFYEPVPQGATPALEQVQRMVKFIQEQSELWERSVVVTCHDGMGQTDIVLACYMVSVGYASERAISYVRELRPGPVQHPEQEEVVNRYAAWWAELTAEIRSKAQERFREQ